MEVKEDKSNAGAFETGLESAGFSVRVQVARTPSPNSNARRIARLLDDAARNCVADIVLFEELIKAGGDELFHAELDLSLLGVEGEHLRFDDFADAHDILRMVHVLVGNHLADVDEAFDAFGQFNEGAELHQACDLAFNGGTDGETLRDVLPGIAEGLLEAERDAAGFGVHRKNQRLDGLAGLEEIAGFVNFLDP